MNKDDIRRLRMNLGKFLHNYFIKFGEEKYDRLIEKMGSKMSIKYGESFDTENLRIMEAEYVTLNALINGKNKSNSKKVTIKK